MGQTRLYPLRPTTVRLSFHCRHRAALPRTAGRGQNLPHALQQTARYSMTWSARVSSGSGTVRPSALAVLRLMIIRHW
jgi:hypothetical protein